MERAARGPAAGGNSRHAGMASGHERPFVLFFYFLNIFKYILLFYFESKNKVACYGMGPWVLFYLMSQICVPCSAESKTRTPEIWLTAGSCSSSWVHF